MKKLSGLAFATLGVAALAYAEVKDVKLEVGDICRLDPKTGQEIDCDSPADRAALARIKQKIKNTCQLDANGWAIQCTQSRPDPAFPKTCTDSLARFAQVDSSEGFCKDLQTEIKPLKKLAAVSGCMGKFASLPQIAWKDLKTLCEEFDGSEAEARTLNCEKDLLTYTGLGGPRNINNAQALCNTISGRSRRDLAVLKSCADKSLKHQTTITSSDKMETLRLCSSAEGKATLAARTGQQHAPEPAKQVRRKGPSKSDDTRAAGTPAADAAAESAGAYLLDNRSSR